MKITKVIENAQWQNGNNWMKMTIAIENAPWQNNENARWQNDK